MRGDEIADAMRMRSIVLTALVCSLSPGLAGAQTGSGPFGSTYTISNLAPGIHTLTWTIPPGSPAIGNSTFIIGEDDVVVVDSGFSKRAGEAILAGLRTLTGKPVSYVINTHWHGDHVFGNQVFKANFPSARFVAHPNTRQRIITGEIDYRAANRPKVAARIEELQSKSSPTKQEAVELLQARNQMEAWEGDYVLPDLLIESRLTVLQGARAIEILHLGLANTQGDVVVHLPAERIAISGDMAITPIQFAFSSSPRAWIQTLDRLAALDVTTLVPGHGLPQTGKQFIRDLQTMLATVVEQVDAGKKAGLDLDRLKATVKVTPPPGSIYEKASAAALDRLFRIPAIESAFAEVK
jgi:cyclase